jgi:hypothetical protein
VNGVDRIDFVRERRAAAGLHLDENVCEFQKGESVLD